MKLQLLSDPYKNVPSTNGHTHARTHTRTHTFAFDRAIYCEPIFLFTYVLALRQKYVAYCESAIKAWKLIALAQKCSTSSKLQLTYNSNCKVLQLVTFTLVKRKQHIEGWMNFEL